MIAPSKSKEEEDVRFPENELVTALTTWWESEALTKEGDPFAPKPAQGGTGTLYELLPALDSLTVVRSFVVIEKVLQIKVPVKLVKPSGYLSCEEMLQDLLPKIQTLWEKVHS